MPSLAPSQFCSVDMWDGAMIVLTMFSLNAFHPGPLLSGPSQDSLSETDKPLAYPGSGENLRMNAV